MGPSTTKQISEYLSLLFPCSLHLDINFYFISISLSLVQDFIIFHQVYFSNFFSGFSPSSPLPLQTGGGGGSWSGSVAASRNLFKTKIVWGTPTQGPEITVPISHPRIQIPSHLFQAGFLTLLSKHLFLLYLTNYLNYLHYCPRFEPLFKLVLCLQCPFLCVHLKGPPPTPRQNWGPLTHSPRHSLAVPLRTLTIAALTVHGGAYNCHLPAPREQETRLLLQASLKTY